MASKIIFSQAEWIQTTGTYTIIMHTRTVLYTGVGVTTAPLFGCHHRPPSEILVSPPPPPCFHHRPPLKILSNPRVTAAPGGRGWRWWHHRLLQHCLAALLLGRGVEGVPA